jgi:hypothetical protein
VVVSGSTKASKKFVFFNSIPLLSLFFDQKIRGLVGNGLGEGQERDVNERKSEVWDQPFWEKWEGLDLVIGIFLLFLFL